MFKNKLCGSKQHPRIVIIEQIAIQAESFSISNFRILTEIDKQVVLKLFELAIHRYSEVSHTIIVSRKSFPLVYQKVRRQAQTYLFTILSRFFFSYQLILDRLVELLDSSQEIDHDQIKGCLYIIFGNDSLFLPTKHSWSMIAKLWPTIASTKHATKLSTQNLINCIMEKLCKRYSSIAILEETNEIAKQAAVNLWRKLNEDELAVFAQVREIRNEENTRLYTDLMGRLTALFSTKPL